MKLLNGCIVGLCLLLLAGCGDDDTQQTDVKKDSVALPDQGADTNQGADTKKQPDTTVDQQLDSTSDAPDGLEDTHVEDTNVEDTNREDIEPPPDTSIADTTDEEIGEDAQDAESPDQDVSPICDNNGMKEGAESCDGEDLGGMNCTSIGYEGGDLACTDQCTFDVTDCFLCGDGIKAANEECDTDDIGVETCDSFGFTGGTLFCNADCTMNLSQCTVCGNGLKEGAEQCDDADLGGINCTELGFSGGELVCFDNCVLDASQCTALPTCGNGILDESEQCDGDILGSSTCQDLGFDKGTLGCLANCSFDLSSCATYVCGDGEVDPGEKCDGNCQEICVDGDPCTIDSSEMCQCLYVPKQTEDDDGCCSDGTAFYEDNDCPSICGNNQVEPGEECEDNCDVFCVDEDPCTDDIPQDCTCPHGDVGKVNGDGCCHPGDSRLDDLDCISVCGNDVLEPGEDCDGDCALACIDGDPCTVDLPSDCTCPHMDVGQVNDDGCCHPGDSYEADNDCYAVCGNAIVEPGEDCDGDCYKACNDGDLCTDDYADNCLCFHVNLGKNNGDGCCHAGDTYADDTDCNSVCGNGILELGEDCDGDCNTACMDGDPCTYDKPENCTCPHMDMGKIDGDGCCHAGDSYVDDTDCASVCGNGVVELGEECETDCDLVCVDADPCTDDTPQDCTCPHSDLGKVNGDGCCHPGDSFLDDTDCTGVCGNGIVEPGEECEDNCDTVCVDGDPCTDDTPDACICPHADVGQVDGDSCCHEGDTAVNDSDCASLCGNGILEPGEECDGDCDTVCVDADPCTDDTSVDCTCPHADVGQADDDGCCHVEDSYADDTDCAAICGNGFLELGEECDGDCDMACLDNDLCTDDTALNCTCPHNDVGILDGDGCCHAGDAYYQDSDCAPVCGNNWLEPGEECEDNCATFCVDGDPCTDDTPDECTCPHTDLGQVDGDGCCHLGDTYADDADCQAACGNSQLDPGEDCDGDCDTVCIDGDPCTDDTPNSCTCPHTDMGQKDGDGCCHLGDTSLQDSDCPGLCSSIPAVPSCTGEWGTTWYVRPDGGDASQCTGQTDTDYPGNGSGLDCAFSHPFVALPPGETPLISGGDRLIIASGDYRMGYGVPEAENLGDCAQDYPWDCVMPSIPSGISSDQPTCIVGAGWNDGCTDSPVLYGVERAATIIDLSGSDNVRLECLEITDHEDCVEFHSGNIECNRDSYPYGDWASGGISATDSQNVTLRNLDVHGLGSSGIYAGRLTDWTLENVRIAANGWVGWDGDVDGADSNSGTTTFKCVTIEWNGCGETYPGGQPTDCWAQTAGGYGDGLGTGATGGDWLFEDCEFLHNTSDGLDLLYHDGGGTITIRRTRAEGNAGNQIKTMGQTSITNSVIVSNCGFFNGQSFTYNVDDCRAGGSAVSVDFADASQITMVNSTIYSEGDTLIVAGSCTGAVSLLARNNIYIGADDFLQPGDLSAILWTDCANFTFDEDYGVIYGAKEPQGYECPMGANDICADPLVLGPLSGMTFGLQITETSPARDNGLDVGALGLIPSIDFMGNTRPHGNGVDRGAYEYSGSLPTPECGNDIKEAGEDCDGDCDTVCIDGDPCTDDTPSNCTCPHTDLGQVGGDGCCHAGDTPQEDSDCAVECGNGIVETGEDCDNNCDTVCNDGDSCTADTHLECICSNTDVGQVDGDGCCHPGDSNDEDNDCAGLCISGPGPDTCTGEWGTTYYVRIDGGDATQCTGLADVDYPGSGSGLDCAFSHPFVALPPGQTPLIQGGDRLIIGPGEYRMGHGATAAQGLDECHENYPWSCHMPSVPSGISSAQPTCIVGAGWNDGCSNAPHLYGAERTRTIIDLEGSSNVHVECLELTDHEGCVEFHSGGIECNRDSYPYGDWAQYGVRATDSTQVMLRNLNVHGFASGGIYAGRLTDWTLEKVRIAGNGWVGWEGDVEGADSNSGTTTFRCVTIEWNGCGESYPNEEPIECWAQQAGGYGDGLGTGATGGDWVFEDCSILHNTSDGLDLLYHDGGGIITIQRTRAEGNAGNQIKTMGEAHITNSVVVGNCGYFEGHTLMVAGDHCRAGGGAISIDVADASQISLINNTIYSEGDVLIGAEDCSGAVTLLARNNIYLGDDDYLQPGDTSAIFWTDCTNLTFNQDYGVIFGVKEPQGYECPMGANDLCEDPLLMGPMNGDSYGMAPMSNSPAVDSGLGVGELGVIPSIDILGNTRPSGAGVDRGAYER